MSLFDKKDRFNILPTRTGVAIGGALERQMLATVDQGDFQKRFRLNPDGSTTMLQTGGGLPRFITIPGVTPGRSQKTLKLYCRLVSARYFRGAQAESNTDGSVTIYSFMDAGMQSWPQYPTVVGELLENQPFKCAPHRVSSVPMSTATWFDGRKADAMRVLSWATVYADGNRTQRRGGVGLAYCSDLAIGTQYAYTLGSYSYSFVPGFYGIGAKTVAKGVYTSWVSNASTVWGFAWEGPGSVRYDKNPTGKYPVHINGVPTGVSAHLLSACETTSGSGARIIRTLEMLTMNMAETQFGEPTNPYSITRGLVIRDYSQDTGSLITTYGPFQMPPNVYGIEDVSQNPRWNSSGTEAIGILRFRVSATDTAPPGHPPNYKAVAENMVAVVIFSPENGMTLRTPSQLGLPPGPFPAGLAPAVVAVDYVVDTPKILWAYLTPKFATKAVCAIDGGPGTAVDHVLAWDIRHDIFVAYRGGAVVWVCNGVEIAMYSSTVASSLLGLDAAPVKAGTTIREQGSSGVFTLPKDSFGNTHVDVDMVWSYGDEFQSAYWPPYGWPGAGDMCSAHLAVDAIGENAVFSASVFMTNLTSAVPKNTPLGPSHVVGINKRLKKVNGTWTMYDLELPSFDLSVWMVEPILIWENP